MSKVHIIMYHYVRDLGNSRYPNIKGLDYGLFKEQIAFLKEHFTVVTMEDVIEACNSENGTLPENAVLLTFDDGYIDNFTAVFPVLKEHNVLHRRSFAAALLLWKRRGSSLPPRPMWWWDPAGSSWRYSHRNFPPDW